MQLTLVPRGRYFVFLVVVVVVIVSLCRSLMIWIPRNELSSLQWSRGKEKKLAAPFVQQQQANATRANSKKFLLSSAATATAGATAITTASLSSSQSLSQSTDDSSTAAIGMTQSSPSSSQPSDSVRQKSTTMPTNHCSSSLPSQDDTSSSSSSNKTRLLQRMISLRRSSSSKPSTPILSSHIPSAATATCRSYNVRAFEIARDRNLRHYPCTIHFLDETERTFHIDVRRDAAIQHRPRFSLFF